ncbi:sensor histidine kinase, partial [Streptomyces sp. TRM76130]|nr:sensor histidine kinase [Streptomyces sp. TRM76130]
VTKHAGTGNARVCLVWNRDHVTLTVVDDGEGSRTTPTASPRPRAFTASDRPPGYGLIGMRERATAVGGLLSAGRRPEGGFLVSVQLPLPPAKDHDAGNRRRGATTEGRSPRSDGVTE